MANHLKATSYAKIGRHSLCFSDLELFNADGSRALSRASAVGLVVTHTLALRDPSTPVIPPSATGGQTGLGGRNKYSEFGPLRDIVSFHQLDTHVKATRSPGAAKAAQPGRQTFRNVASSLIKELGLGRACTCGELLAAMRACDQVFAFTFGAAGQGEAEGLRSLRLSEMVQIVVNECIDLTDSPSRDNAIELHLCNMPGVELPADSASPPPTSPPTPANLAHYGDNPLAHCESLSLPPTSPASTSTNNNYMCAGGLACLPAGLDLPSLPSSDFSASLPRGTSVLCLPGYPQPLPAPTSSLPSTTLTLAPAPQLTDTYGNCCDYMGLPVFSQFLQQPPAAGTSTNFMSWWPYGQPGAPTMDTPSPTLCPYNAPPAGTASTVDHWGCSRPTPYGSQPFEMGEGAQLRL